MKKRNMPTLGSPKIPYEDTIEWYENLPDASRRSLSLLFDTVYDGLGDRERKFYEWAQSYRESHIKPPLVTLPNDPPYKAMARSDRYIIGMDNKKDPIEADQNHPSKFA